MMMPWQISGTSVSGRFRGLSNAGLNGSNVKTPHSNCSPASVHTIVGSMQVPITTNSKAPRKQTKNGISNS
jgi:hypothetical protein